MVKTKKERVFGYYKQIPESEMMRKIREIFLLTDEQEVYIESGLPYDEIQITIIEIHGAGFSMYELKKLQEFTERDVISIKPENFQNRYTSGVIISLSHEVGPLATKFS